MMPQSDFGICDRINHLMNEKCLTAYAEYDTGTRYIVAENKEIGFCYICRILDKSEIKES